MTTKSLFLIGPGFIGSEILGLLTKSGNENYDITVLVRSEASAKTIHERFGNNLHTVIGTLDDSELITKHAREANITIHSATADHPPSVEAVLAGIKEKIDSNPDLPEPIFIHTSGSAVLADDSNSNYASDTIYDDAEPAALNALPDSAPHRNVDLVILNARKALGSKANKIVLMIPTMIEGVGQYGGGRTSIQTPQLIRFALKRGYAGYVGAGLARLPYVHVVDLARGYVTLLHHLESVKAGSKEDLALGENPYFFCESGKELSWKDVSAAIGKELKKLGKIEDAEPRSVPEEEYGDLFGAFTVPAIGVNSRHRATRLRKLGWEAKEKDFAAGVVEDVIPAVLKEQSKAA